MMFRAGWWRVKRGAEEGWAPHNYLELIPPKPKPVAAPPPPARRAPPAAPKPTATPGVAAAAAANGLKTAAARPTPPVSTKPKPAAPPVGAKPAAPKPPGAGGKPPVPASARPVPSPAPKPAAAGAKAGGAPGQLDLAAAVRRQVLCYAAAHISWRSWQSARSAWETSRHGVACRIVDDMCCRYIEDFIATPGLYSGS